MFYLHNRKSKLLQIFALFGTLVLVPIQGEEQIQGDTMSKASPIVDADSYYQIKIDRADTQVQVLVNGMKVFESLSKAQSIREMHVSEAFTSGDNEIVLKVWATERTDYKMLPEARAKVSLYVYDEKGDKSLISELSYAESSSEKYTSTPAGGYNWMGSGFQSVQSGGEIQIGALKINYPTRFNTGEIKGTELVQKLNIPAAIPRWKFLDSDNILDKDFNYLTLDEYYEFKDSPLIQDLYAQYDRIHKGFKNNDIDSIIDMYDERNEEFDTVFHRPFKGWQKKYMLNKFQKTIDQGCVLEPFDHSASDVFIERNNKLAYVDHAIVCKKPESIGGGYRNSKATFRLENGKWILTR